MSKIFELYGYRLDRWNEAADANLRIANCPFMGITCDGGGNRNMSALDLDDHPELARKFPGFDRIQAGVCSLSVTQDGQPWIVCPRRLLSLKQDGTANHQEKVKDSLFRYSELPAGKYGVWSEVKMKTRTSTTEDEEKSFDYTFDYVLAALKRTRLGDAARILGVSYAECRKMAVDAGLTIVRIAGEEFIDDFPCGSIYIVEIMTSSTSGGDKKKRTQIAMAFEDAVLKRPHSGPGINYRQVWARMVSQLIVKSQVALAWEGKTVWLIQDVLADYISSSTALNLRRYISEHPDEVNILSFRYPERAAPIMELEESNFFSGPISGDEQDAGFVDIVKIGAAPPVSALWYSLFKKVKACTLTLPYVPPARTP